LQLNQCNYVTKKQCNLQFAVSDIMLHILVYLKGLKKTLLQVRARIRNMQISNLIIDLKT